MARSHGGLADRQALSHLRRRVLRHHWREPNIDAARRGRVGPHLPRGCRLVRIILLNGFISVGKPKLTLHLRYPPTDEVFFVQNAGAPAAGTGLNKSAIVEKISLADAAAVANGTSENVTVTTVNSNPQVINPNGTTSLLLAQRPHGRANTNIYRRDLPQGQHPLHGRGNGRQHWSIHLPHEPG